MAKEKNSFKDAVGMYMGAMKAKEDYEKSAAVANIPLQAAKIAEEAGDRTAAEYLLKPDTPDHLKLPFIQTRVNEQLRELSDFVDKNMEGILTDVPRENLEYALGMIDNKEKVEVLKRYYSPKEGDDEEVRDIKNALLNLYSNIPEAFMKRYAEIVIGTYEKGKGLAKYILSKIPGGDKPDGKLGFFQALLGPEKQEK